MGVAVVEWSAHRYFTCWPAVGTQMGRGCQCIFIKEVIKKTYCEVLCNKICNPQLNKINTKRYKRLHRFKHTNNGDFNTMF